MLFHSILYIHAFTKEGRSKGKEGHSAAAQIVSGSIAPLLFSLQTCAHTV